MKLRIIDKGKEKYIEVKFWSFLKCTILVQLVIAGFTYAFLFFIFFVFGFMSALV